MATDASAVRATPRAWVILLGLAAVVLLLVFRWESAGPASRSSNSGTARAGRAASAAGAIRPESLSVKLDRLNVPPPEPDGGERNPFRFQPKPMPAPIALPPSGHGAAPRGRPFESAEASGRSAVPPIPLKFIGIVEAPGVGTIAALSDGRAVFHGREGDIIDGRYRVVHIGVESIVMEHVDGRGRQTIPLTGQ